eukprot:3534070-Pleurochrysis_carterae.AAC.1
MDDMQKSTQSSTQKSARAHTHLRLLRAGLAPVWRVEAYAKDSVGLKSVQRGVGGVGYFTKVTVGVRGVLYQSDSGRAW